MSEPTTEMMNEVIAVFDGWELIKGNPTIVCPSCDEGKVPSGWCICDQKADRFQKDGKMVSRSYFQYHTSWDWLMPVVEKIEAMEWCVRIENWPKKFKSPYKELYSVWMWLDPEDCPEIQTYSDSKIEAVHRAVYQFITWYNQQKQNNERQPE